MTGCHPIIHIMPAILSLAIYTVNTSADEADISTIGKEVLVEVTQTHMGMPVYLRVYANDLATGRRACKAAFERIAELNLILSDYERDSELSRLLREPVGRPVVVSDELFEVLSASLQLAEQTQGLFDPTAAPVTRLWRQARRDRVLPADTAVEEAFSRVGYTHIRMDASRRTVQRLIPGMQLDLGGIAKGYIGDEAVRVLREQGINSCMFEAGGDMVFGDAPPGQAGWLVEPEPETLPTQRLSNCAVAISGDTVQFVVIDGKRYGHIIDPRTGKPVLTRRACMVVAPTGLSADPLATIGTIMPEDDYTDLLDKHHPDARAWVVTLSDPSTAPLTEPRP